MSSSKDEVGLKPTSTIGANNGANAAHQVLGATSNFNAVMKENVKDAPHAIKLFLKVLTDENLSPEDDHSKHLETAMKELSPQKSNATLQAQFEGALSQVEVRAPSPKKGKKGKAAKASPAAATPQTTPARGSESDERTQSPYKNLKETMNMTGLMGPVATFLENILEKQSRVLKAQFATIGDKKHAIYLAIENLQLGEFRKLLKAAFNKVYPMQSRIRARLEKMTAFEYDPSKHDLLHLRELYMDTIRDIIDITDDKDLSGPRGLFAAEEIKKHFAEAVSIMKPMVMTVVMGSLHTGVEIMQIEEILSTADTTLRQSAPLIYLPTEEVVWANVARPERKTIRNPCPACKFVWGNSKANHPLEECYMHPTNIDENRAWFEKKSEYWLKRNHGKTIPTFKWDTIGATKKRPREASPKSSSDRGL